jgi:hypothetical protein
MVKHLNEDNFEIIAATLVLMSAKMNDTTFPKMFELAQKCSKMITKDDMVELEEWILSVFSYDMSFP